MRGDPDNVWGIKTIGPKDGLVLLVYLFRTEPVVACDGVEESDAEAIAIGVSWLGGIIESP